MGGRLFSQYAGAGSGTTPALMSLPRGPARTRVRASSSGRAGAFAGAAVLELAEPDEDATRPHPEAPGIDRRTRSRHELSVPVQVVQRQKPQTQDLAGEIQVPEVGARVALRAARACARFVDRASVVLVAGLLDDDAPGACERLAVSGVARGQDAVDHVRTGADGDDQVARRSDAHPVARALLVEGRGDLLGRRVHPLHGLAHGEAAEGQPVEGQGTELVGVRPAKVGEARALDDPEE